MCNNVGGAPVYSSHGLFNRFTSPVENWLEEEEHLTTHINDGLSCINYNLPYPVEEKKDCNKRERMENTVFCCTYIDFKQQGRCFFKGQILEAENKHNRLYKDTISYVFYVEESKEMPGYHSCYDVGCQRFDYWKADELHELRHGSEWDNYDGKHFQVGEKVHICICNRTGVDFDRRRYSGLDGNFTVQGVPVKAVVVEVCSNGTFKVRRIVWNARHKDDKYVTVRVTVDKVRKGY